MLSLITIWYVTEKFKLLLCFYGLELTIKTVEADNGHKWSANDRPGVAGEVYSDMII